MNGSDKLIRELASIVSSPHDRIAALQSAADTIRRSADYRWVGLYDVDHAAGIVRNVVYSGPGAPAFPQFPIHKGLTGSAVAERRTVNAGDVTADARYLTAFGSTRSEIIVPILDLAKQRVLGTIDIESELPDAFNTEAQALFEQCADVIGVLWR
jgi:putative methionine-R-sulfoxide reductase with GAF domain